MKTKKENLIKLLVIAACTAALIALNFAFRYTERKVEVTEAREVSNEFQEYSAGLPDGTYVAQTFVSAGEPVYGVSSKKTTQKVGGVRMSSTNYRFFTFIPCTTKTGSQVLIGTLSTARVDGGQVLGRQDEDRVRQDAANLQSLIPEDGSEFTIYGLITSLEDDEILTPNVYMPFTGMSKPEKYEADMKALGEATSSGCYFAVTPNPSKTHWVKEVVGYRTERQENKFLMYLSIAELIGAVWLYRRIRSTPVPEVRWEPWRIGVNDNKTKEMNRDRSEKIPDQRSPQTFAQRSPQISAQRSPQLSAQRSENKPDCSKILTSQLVALWKSTKNEDYKAEYLRRMKICGLSDPTALQMLNYEEEILDRYPRPEMRDADFISKPLMDLRKPFLQKGYQYYADHFEYPLSYLVKLSDEAEYHYWNSHESSLPDKVWEEIYYLSDKHQAIFIPFATDLVDNRGWTVGAVNRFSYNEQRMLDRYRWDKKSSSLAKPPWASEERGSNKTQSEERKKELECKRQIKREKHFTYGWEGEETNIFITRYDNKYYLCEEKTVVSSGANGRPQFSKVTKLYPITEKEEKINERNYTEFMRDGFTYDSMCHDSMPSADWLKDYGHEGHSE